jgi:hypothetical protein
MIQGLLFHHHHSEMELSCVPDPKREREKAECSCLNKKRDAPLPPPPPLLASSSALGTLGRYTCSTAMCLAEIEKRPSGTGPRRLGHVCQPERASDQPQLLPNRQRRVTSLYFVQGPRVVGVPLLLCDCVVCLCVVSPLSLSNGFYTYI